MLSSPYLGAENVIGFIGVFQVFFCSLVAVGIAVSMSTALVKFPLSYRVPLCFIGAGAIITAGGLLAGNLWAIKIGHIIENAGLCGIVINLMFLAIVKRRKCPHG